MEKPEVKVAERTRGKEEDHIITKLLFGNGNSIDALVKIGMEIGLIFKIAAVGILVTILGQVLKHSGREEHAFLISLAGLIVVLSWILPYIYNLFQSIQTLFQL